MGRANSHKKKIACIESLWDGNIEHRLSVVPMLELTERVKDVGWAYLTCNTEEELKYNLGKLRHRRGYGILYLSCHGRPGELVFDKDTVEIEKLGQFLGDGLRTGSFTSDRAPRSTSRTPASRALSPTRGCRW